MDTTSEAASLYSLLDSKDTKIVLEPPEQVFASEGLYSGIILISWKEAENATSYRVERAVISPDANGNYRVPEEADFNVLRPHFYKTVYTDTILSNPSYNNDEYQNLYYYRISSENISKNLDASEFSDWTQEATKGCGYLLPPPTNTEATKGKSSTSITLTWNAVKDATAYKIYRSKNSDFSSSEVVSSVLGNVLKYSNSISTADQGIEFYYKVSAVNSSGNESAQSSIAMGYALQAGAPSAPETVTVKDGYGTSTSELTVTWTEVTNTSENGGELTYSLYRTSSKDSVYQIVKSGISGTEWTDTSAKTGVYYYYYIQSVITEGSGETATTIKSAFSESGASSKNPAMGFLLSAPSSLEIIDSSADGKVYAVWPKAIGADYADFTYNLYSSTLADSGYTVISGAEKITGSDYSEKDSTYENYLYAEVDKANFFKVSTVNSAGLESSLSSAAAPLPDAATNVSATKTEKLTQNFVANTNGVYPVLVTWEKPEEDTPSGYYIYRSTKPDSSFRKITDSAVTTADSSGKYFYYDVNDTAKVGTFYFYKVVSLNSLGQGSLKKANDPSTDTERNSWGYGAITRDRWFVAYNQDIFSSQAKLKLMHKSGNMAKLGSEHATANIAINGTYGDLSYDASISGLSGVVIMLYTNYADHYISDNQNYGVYFLLNGNTNTKAGTDTNGNMYGTVTCSHSFKNDEFIGMYPGTVKYDKVEIKGGAAGGGYYTVETKDLNGNEVFSAEDISWTYGNEK